MTFNLDTLNNGKSHISTRVNLDISNFRNPLTIHMAFDLSIVDLSIPHTTLKIYNLGVVNFLYPYTTLAPTSSTPSIVKSTKHANYRTSRSKLVRSAKQNQKDLATGVPSTLLKG